MTVLDKLRHEACARAGAKGVPLDDAYDEAGYTPERGHACRLAKQPDIAALESATLAERVSIERVTERGRIEREPMIAQEKQ